MSEVLIGIEWIVALTVTIFLAIIGIYVFLMRHEREFGGLQTKMDELDLKLQFILKHMGLLNPQYQAWREEQLRRKKLTEG